MKINILMFALAREITGAPSVELDLPDNSTLEGLKQVLVKQFPELEAIVHRSAFSIDMAYAHDGQTIPTDSEIGMIPPVSGG